MELRRTFLIYVIAFTCFLQLTSVKAYKYLMLTSPFQPMVSCTVGDTVKANFSGLDIDLFNTIAKSLGWSDSDFSYECIDYSDLSSKLSEIDKYVGFVGGLSIDPKREQEGVKFSYPMWNTGISMVIYSKNDFWLQVTVLTSQLCGVVVSTSLVIGFIHFFLEQKEHSLEQFLWNSMTSIFFITTINLKRSGSRLIQITFWFMIMIVSSTYLAKMTNILTIEQPLYQIKNPYDLNNKRTITYSIYNYELYQYGAIPLTSDFGAPANTLYDDISADQIIYNLGRSDSYKVDAYVIDDIQAQYIEYANCNIYIRGRNFYQFNYGIGFNYNQDPTLTSSINKAIQLNTISMSTEQLVTSYISKSQTQCVKGSQDDQITFDQVGGLYVIQAIAICVGIVIFFLAKVPLFRRILKNLEKYKIISEPPQEQKEIHGDELVLENIKKVTKEQITKFEQIIEDRLDEMDENVIKFYEILLNEDQLKKLKILQEQDKIKKDQINSVQASKIEDSFQNIFVKKAVEEKELNSENKEEKESKNQFPHSSNIGAIGEVEMAVFDQDHDSIDKNQFN